MVILLLLLSFSFSLSFPSWVFSRQMETGVPPTNRQSSQDKATEQANAEEGSATRNLALALVESAVRRAEELEPESKGYLLALAGEAVAAVDPEKAMAYYLAAFDSTEKMVLIGPPDFATWRGSLQAMIVPKIARLDLEKAVEVARRLDNPRWTGNPSVDTRQQATLDLIRRLLASDDSERVEKALELMAFLADTGQYPYRAATQAIQFFHGKGEDWRGSEVFSQAIGQFEKDETFRDSPEEFVDLIIAGEGQVDGSLLLQAIRSVARCFRKEQSKNDEKPKHPEPTFLTGSKAGSIRVRGRRTYLILRLLPLATRLDARAAKELAAGEVQLQSLLEKHKLEELESWSRSSPIVVYGEPTAQRLDDIEGELSLRQNVQEALENAGRDPEKALGFADGMESPIARCRVLLGVARALANADASRAASMLHEAEALSEKVGEASERLQLLAELADVWGGPMKNHKRASGVLAAAFSLARDHYAASGNQESKPTWVVDPFTLYLAELALVDAKIDPTSASKRSEMLPDPRLRAFYALVVAQGILSPQT